MRIILVDISAFVPASPAASILWITQDSCGISPVTSGSLSTALAGGYQKALLRERDRRTSRFCIYIGHPHYRKDKSFIFSHSWISASVSWPVTFLQPHTTPRPRALRAIPGGPFTVRCSGQGSPPAPYDCAREAQSRWAWERDESGGQRMESSGCSPFPLCWARGACIYSYPPPLPSMSPRYSTEASQPISRKPPRYGFTLDLSYRMWCIDLKAV